MISSGPRVTRLAHVCRLSAVLLATLGGACSLAAISRSEPLGHTYYLDSTRGNDTRDGTSPERAWRSLSRANVATFGPGDRILFRAGSAWEGTFQPKGSGRPDHPIVVDRYGEGALPALHGRGKVPCVLRLENQEYWEINRLEITNRSESGPKDLRGVEIRGRDAGVLHHLYLRELSIHDVNAVSDYRNDGDTVAKSFGGLAAIIEGTERQTAWDDLRVERCRIRSVGPMGMVMLSSWMGGHRENDPRRWFPSRRVMIRGNTIERTARNGLIVRGCAGPLIERNLFRECALEGSGNACFAFHCDDAIFQYNEACFTKYNPGDTDASGYDSDYYSRRTVFQYNYSHDNDYGFMLLCNRGPLGFNEGTIVRYNISQNDGGNVFRISGAVTGARIYNNTIYASPKTANPKAGDPPRLVYFKSWNNGWSDDLAFYNNVFVNHSPAAVYELGESTGTRFSHNLFSGLHPESEPADPHKLTADPLLTRPGVAEAGSEAAAAAYRLRPGSPAIGVGEPQPSHSHTDFAERPTGATGGRVDLGALAAAR